MSDPIKTTSMISALFNIMSGNDAKTPEDRLKVVEQRARFYKQMPGIIWPEDWDKLPLEEKERRIDGLDKIGLGKESNE